LINLLVCKGRREEGGRREGGGRVEEEGRGRKEGGGGGARGMRLLRSG
jgi:hypothetical protein